MECPEQFALGYIDGWRTKGLKPKMEWGNLWHLCEELHGHLVSPPYSLPEKEILKTLDKATLHYCRDLTQKIDERDVPKLHSLRLSVLEVFKVYLYVYREEEVRWFRREHAFTTPHPIGIDMRGKRDGEYYFAHGSVEGMGLWETKTKSRIDRDHLRSLLCCDAQTLYYLYSMKLDHEQGRLPLPPIHLTYNVIKRPQLRQKANETPEQYARRCGEHALEKQEEYFWRYTTVVNPHELEEFNTHYLEPSLRSFMKWWHDLPGPSPEERKQSPSHYANLNALVHPYGKSDYFEALVYNQLSLLEKLDDCFPELQSEKIVEEALHSHKTKRKVSSPPTKRRKRCESPRGESSPQTTSAITRSGSSARKARARAS